MLPDPAPVDSASQLESIPAATRRQVYDFDFDWRFYREDPAGGIDASEAGYDDRGWDAIRLPHDFSLAQPFDKDAPAGGSGGHLPGGVGWYRKRFLVEQTGPARIYVEFDGVYRNSDVWLNGVHLGHRQYGYAPFRYDITDHVRYGQVNVLTVRADNSDQPNCRWYSGSGIYRHVRLVLSQPLALAPWGVRITTCDELSDAAGVCVRAAIENAADAPAQARLAVEILDTRDRTVATDAQPVSVAAGDQASAQMTLRVAEPRLWSPQEPNLYSALCRIEDAEGNVTDTRRIRFGIRRIRLDPDKGFRLNGKVVKLKGGNIHHDGGCVGSAVPEAVWRRRLETFKALGANTVRMSHNPPAREVLALCDEIGLMVYDEAFDKWAAAFEPVPWVANTNPTFEQDWQKDLDAMVLRDRNHPSIVIWSVGNEVIEYGQDPPRCVEIFRRLRDRVRELDNTRPITMALQYVPNRQEALHESGLAEEVDLISTNYQEGNYADDRRRQGRKLMLGSETKPFFTTDRGGRKAHFVPRNPWQDVVDQDYVIGGLLWTIIDYFGEAAWPRNGWCTSIVDTSGRPKPRSNYFQCAWADTPQVRLQVRDTSLPATSGKLSWDAPGIACHWNWPEKVDGLVHVEVPTNCQQVELLLNGETCGVRQTADETTSTIEWYVPYEPGTLEAVGRNDGKDVARCRLETTGPAHQLRLTADRTTLRGDGHDAAHVIIEVVDAQGRPVPDYDVYVNVNVAGAGELLGMDNGDQISKEPCFTPRRRTWRGQCLAVVRARRGAGGMTVRVTSEQFDSVQTRLDVHAP